MYSVSSYCTVKDTTYNEILTCEAFVAPDAGAFDGGKYAGGIAGQDLSEDIIVRQH